jgi:hypothetical protein
MFFIFVLDLYRHIWMLDKEHWIGALLGCLQRSMHYRQIQVQALLRRRLYIGGSSTSPISCEVGFRLFITLLTACTALGSASPTAAPIRRWRDVQRDVSCLPMRLRSVVKPDNASRLALMYIRCVSCYVKYSFVSWMVLSFRTTIISMKTIAYAAENEILSYKKHHQASSYRSFQKRISSSISSGRSREAKFSLFGVRI